jgi:hypothetical protein
MEYISPEEGLMRDLQFLCQSHNRVAILKTLQSRGLLTGSTLLLKDFPVEDLRRAKRALEKTP